MTSLLSPFHFGQQRHAYFQLRVTIHELSNVPLVSGNFQARWKIRNAHGGGPHIPGAHHLPQLNTHANSKGKGKVKSAAEEVEEDDAASKGTHHRESTAEEDDPTLDAASTNAGLRGHAEAFGSRTEAATSSKGFLSKVLPGKRSADSSARHSPAADANSPASAYASLYSDSPRHGSSPRDSSDRHTSRSRPEDSPKQAPAASLAAKSSSAATEMQISEPRGETHFTRVRDHCASWERVVETGLRMTVEKPRNASGGSTSSANYPPASAGTSKEGFSTHLSPYGEPAKSNGRLHKSHSSRSLRTNQGAPEGHDASVGLLASSELRISVKTDVSTDASSNHGETLHRLGFVVINLAEYAPTVPKHHHHHHHHHHHPHHHAHHHQHQHGHGHGGHVAPYRSETRRYLLSESRTNATLKLTIEMAYVGGLPDFAVPSIRVGLPVGGLGSLLDGAAASLGNNTDSSSDGAGGHQSGHNTAASSNVSLPNAALSSWSPSSVARHARIPASNLTTELSAKELARASKVSGAGAGRLAFSFAGAAHHDRPPEEVIDAIFHPGPASNAVLMLQSTVSRADKVQRDSGGRAGAKTPSSKQGRSGDGSTRASERRAAEEKERDAEDLRAMAGAPKPEHYDAISPAQSPVDSTEAQGYRSIPTALASPAETVTQGSHYGADETLANRLTTIISADEDSSAPTTKPAGAKESQIAAKPDSKDSGVTSQGSGSSLSSVRPILSTDPRSRKGSRAAAAGGATGLQKRNSTSTTSSEYTDGQSKRGSSRPHSVHWDTNSFTEPNAKGSGSTDSDVRESHRTSPVFPQAPAVVKDREVTASPRSISPSRERDRQFSGSTTAQSQRNKGAIKKGDDVFTTDRASDAGIVGGTKLLSNQEAQGETMEQTLSAAQGVSREDMAGSGKKAGEALESHEGAHGWNKPSPAKLPQQKPRARVLRGAVGISPDEAARKGYHGAGWGNLQATCLPGGALLKPACAPCSPAFSSSDRHSSGQWIWSSPEGSPQYSRIARDFALGQTPAQARGAATEVGAAGDDHGSGGRRASAIQNGDEQHASVEQVMDAAMHSDLESANDLTPKAARQAVHA